MSVASNAVVAPKQIIQNRPVPQRTISADSLKKTKQPKTAADVSKFEDLHQSMANRALRLSS